MDTPRRGDCTGEMGRGCRARRSAEDVETFPARSRYRPQALAGGTSRDRGYRRRPDDPGRRLSAGADPHHPDPLLPVALPSRMERVARRMQPKRWTLGRDERTVGAPARTIGMPALPNPRKQSAPAGAEGYI